MKLVRVVKKNESDPNPWIPSGLPFVVLKDLGEILVIAPFGISDKSKEAQAHWIPVGCVQYCTFKNGSLVDVLSEKGR